MSGDSDGDGTVPWRSVTLYVILSSSMMGVMGVTLISPLLPELRSVFNVSDTQVGLIITAYTLPGIVLVPFIGLLADRFGRRRVVIPMLFTFGLTGVGIAFARSFTEVILLRFLQGGGASALITLSVTLIGDLFEGPQQNAVMGINSSMIGTAAALYPMIGGILAGIRWNAPFLFYSVGIAVGLLALFVLPEPGGQQPTPLRTYLRQLGGVARKKRAVAMLLAVFMIFFVFYGAIQTAMPLLLTDDFGLNSREIGLTLAMVSVASATLSSQFGRISGLVPPSQLVPVGFVVTGVSLLSVWVAPSPVFVGGSLLVFGVGLGLIMPSIDTMVVDLVSDRLRAGVIGMRTSMLRTGQTLGPVSFTFVAEVGFSAKVTGYRSLILFFGLLQVTLGLGVYTLLWRQSAGQSVVSHTDD